MPISFTNPYAVTDFILGLLLLIALITLMGFFCRKLLPTLIFGILGVLTFFFYCLGLTYCAIVFTVLFAVAFLLILFVNMSFFRTFISANSNSSLLHLARKKRKTDAEELYDQDDFLNKLVTSVLTMSRLKRGALITVEKKDDILAPDKVGTMIRQKGVEINAPFVPELVETIFYEGTRLHDGAVVVKNGMILRAAVFFVSTQRALDGKFGSRHQAAIGISENSDSVTVIVSEETGRIAIAFQGELTPVSSDNLLRVLEDDLAYQDDSADY